MPRGILEANQRRNEPGEMAGRTETSFPAGEATPLQITDLTPEPRLPSQRSEHNQPQQLPRPRSSWYSQPGISNASVYSTRYQTRPPSSPPPVPRLTSATLRSLEERFASSTNRRSEIENGQYYGISNPWQHQQGDAVSDDDGHSPTSVPSRKVKPVRRVSVDAFLSANKHTPVSEYLRDRTWIPESPSMSSGQPFDASGLSRRESLRRSVSSLVDRTIRKGSTSSSGDSDREYSRVVGSLENRKSVLTARPERRKSSIPNMPHLLEEEHQMSQPVDRWPQVHRLMPTSSQYTRSSNGTNIGIPYEDAKTGPTPTPVTTLWTTEIQRSRRSSQKPRPRVVTRPLTPAVSSSRTPVSAAPSSSYQNRNNPLARVYARPPTFTQILRTRTRDAFECSEQGSYLFIGTLRGPTPAGLRTLHAAMNKAIAKHGEVEGAFKGCKEVRKWLRHEERGVIEWTLAYVRGRWGVEV